MTASAARPRPSTVERELSCVKGRHTSATEVTVAAVQPNVSCVYVGYPWALLIQVVMQWSCNGHARYVAVARTGPAIHFFFLFTTSLFFSLPFHATRARRAKEQFNNAPGFRVTRASLTKPNKNKPRRYNHVQGWWGGGGSSSLSRAATITPYTSSKYFVSYSTYKYNTSYGTKKRRGGHRRTTSLWCLRVVPASRVRCTAFATVTLSEA